jgi:hypothetical protein
LSVIMELALRVILVQLVFQGGERLILLHEA